MIEKLALLAAAQCGVFLRSQALANGFTPNEITRKLRAADWIAVRRGSYAFTKDWHAMTDVEQHRALCFAVAAKIGPEAVISHASAVALHDLPTWGLDLAEVHVSSSNVSRHAGGVHHHRAGVPSLDVVRISGVAVTAVRRALIETALVSATEPAIVTMDAALRHGLTSKQELLDAINSMRDWPGARNAGRVVAFADGLSESVGESRARFAFHLADLPEPILQHEIYDGWGKLVARSDFLFEEQRTIAEFDGKIKYTGELTPGSDPVEVLWHEKRREDQLRALGFEVVRVTWSDLRNADALGGKVRAAFARAQRMKRYA